MTTNRFDSLGMVELGALIHGLKPQVAAAKRSARTKKETYRASQLVPLLKELQAAFDKCGREMAERDGIADVEPMDLSDLKPMDMSDLLPSYD